MLWKSFEYHLLHSADEGISADLQETIVRTAIRTERQEPALHPEISYEGTELPLRPAYQIQELRLTEKSFFPVGRAALEVQEALTL